MIVNNYSYIHVALTNNNDKKEVAYIRTYEQIYNILQLPVYRTKRNDTEIRLYTVS